MKKRDIPFYVTCLLFGIIAPEMTTSGTRLGYSIVAILAALAVNRIFNPRRIAA